MLIDKENGDVLSFQGKTLERRLYCGIFGFRIDDEKVLL
jgi:hypothetical protein